MPLTSENVFATTGSGGGGDTDTADDDEERETEQSQKVTDAREGSATADAAAAVDASSKDAGGGDAGGSSVDGRGTDGRAGTATADDADSTGDTGDAGSAFAGLSDAEINARVKRQLADSQSQPSGGPSADSSDKDTTDSAAGRRAESVTEREPEPVVDPEPSPEPVVDSGAGESRREESVTEREPEPVVDPEPSPEPERSPGRREESVTEREPDTTQTVESDVSPDAAARREDKLTDREPITASETADATVGGGAGQNRGERVQDRAPDAAADPTIPEAESSSAGELTGSGKGKTGAPADDPGTVQQAAADVQSFVTRNRNETVQGTSVPVDDSAGQAVDRVQSFVTRNTDETVPGADVPKNTDGLDAPTAEQAQRFLRTGEVETPFGEVPVGTESVRKELRSRYEVGGSASGLTDEEFNESRVGNDTLLSVDLDPNRGGFASQYTPGGVEPGDEVEITTGQARRFSGQTARGLFLQPTTAGQATASLGIEAGQETDYIVRGSDNQFDLKEDLGRATGYQRGKFAGRYTDVDTTEGVERTGRAEMVTARVSRSLERTKEFIVDNPARGVGSLAAGAVVAVPASIAAGAALGRGARYVRDRARTVGGTKVDLEDVTQKEVVQNVESGGTSGRRFPAAADRSLYRKDAPAAVRRQAQDKTPEEIKETFRQAGVDDGVTLKKAVGREPEGPETKRSARGFEAPEESATSYEYEAPGSFVGPELSPNFLRVEGRRSFSLRPGMPDMGNRPTGVLVRTDVDAPDATTLSGVKDELVARSGETTARTKPAGNPGEIEAIIPPGAEFVNVGSGGVVRNLARRAGVGSDFYTTVAGRRVPLRLAAAADDVDAGGPGVRSFLDDDRAQVGGTPKTRRRTFELSDYSRTVRPGVDRPTAVPPVAAGPKSSSGSGSTSRSRDVLQRSPVPPVSSDPPVLDSDPPMTPSPPSSRPPVSYKPPSDSPPGSSPPGSSPPGSSPPGSSPPGSSPPGGSPPGGSPPGGSPPGGSPPGSQPPSSTTSSPSYTRSLSSPATSPSSTSSVSSPLIPSGGTPPPRTPAIPLQPNRQSQKYVKQLGQLHIRSFTPLSNIGFGQSDPIEYAGSDGTQQLDIGPTRDTTDGNDAQRLAFTFDTDSADDDGTSYYNLLDDSPTPNLNLNYI